MSLLPIKLIGPAIPIYFVYVKLLVAVFLVFLAFHGIT